MPKIEHLADGGFRTTYTPDEKHVADRVRELLRPDHACTGHSSFSINSSEWHPCQGCVRQQERVFKKYPELFGKMPDAYAQIVEQMQIFRKNADADLNGDRRYYEGMASGLEVALQLIDRKRWERGL